MNQRAFLTIIRRYADLAQRHRTSYSEQVTTITKLRHDFIVTTVEDPEERQKQLNAMFNFVHREYTSVDPTHTTDIIPF